MNKNLSEKLHTDSQGIAHIALILVIVLVVAVGGVGYYVYQNNKKNPTPIAKTTTSTTQPTVSVSCPGFESDKELCAFVGTTVKAFKEGYKANFTNADKSGKQTTTSFETDGNSNVSLVTKADGVESFAFVVVGGSSYIKNEATNRWTKYPGGSSGSLSTNPVSELTLENDASKPEAERISYKKIGKEACGSATCVKYQIVDPSKPGTVSFIWFGEKDYLAHKWSFKDTDGAISVGEFTFTSVSIGVPSPLN